MFGGFGQPNLSQFSEQMLMQQLQEQQLMALQNAPAYYPYERYFDNPSLNKIDAPAWGEDRIDVPHEDWQRWQNFRRAPWWRKLLLIVSRQY